MFDLHSVNVIVMVLMPRGFVDIDCNFVLGDRVVLPSMLAIMLIQMMQCYEVLIELMLCFA